MYLHDCFSENESERENAIGSVQEFRPSAAAASSSPFP